jgi:hypothetical protein
VKGKKKGLKITLIVLLCLVVAGFGALGYYLYQQANSGVFFEETTINGYDVAGMTSKEVLLLLEQNYSAPTLQLREQGEEALTMTLADMGYTINEKELLSNIKDCMTKQTTSLLFSLMDGNEFEVEVPFDFSEDTFEAEVTASNLATPRSSSVDASMQFNGTEYYMEPEVYGNELDDADLQVMVKDYADRMVSSDRPAENGTMDIPESFYFLPAVYQDDSELTTLMNIYNSYCKAKITYTFGEVTEVVDWSTIQNWLEIEDGTATLLEESVTNYVSDLAGRYNTLYYQRDFVTHDGETIHYESSDYGYQIDQEGEAAQLIQDIYNNTETEREPVYAQKGYVRNGRDDICGNYVEANLTKQHLWFYKDGELVIETDFVSGLPTEERETTTGVFVIPYKKSPETLKGDTWEEEVTYWMPFYDGQGLHDAPWRSEFGGTIYQTNGSHGCINLPADAAKVIYDNMEERMAIFLYK